MKWAFLGPFDRGNAIAQWGGGKFMSTKIGNRILICKRSIDLSHKQFCQACRGYTDMYILKMHIIIYIKSVRFNICIIVVLALNEPFYSYIKPKKLFT